MLVLLLLEVWDCIRSYIGTISWSVKGLRLVQSGFSVDVESCFYELGRPLKGMIRLL